MALLVELTSNGGNVQQQIPVSAEGFKISARADTRYRITDDANPAGLQSAQVRRVGDDLVIDIAPGKATVIIVDFYFVCRFDYRSCFLELDTLGGSKNDRVDAEEDPTQKLADGSFLVWTPPVAPVAAQAAGPTGAANSASVPETTIAVREASGPPDGSEPLPWGTIGAAGAGLLVVAAVGGGGSNGASQPPVGSDPTPPDPGNGGPPLSPSIKADEPFNSGTPTISGTAEAGATLTLSINVGAAEPAVYSTTVDAAGNWSINTASAPPDSGALPPGGLPTGSVSVSAIATDAAGNASAPAQATLQIALPDPDDNTAPAVPTVDAVTGDDLITAQEANAAVAVSGTAEVASRVTVIWAGVSLTTTAAADGRYEVTFPATTVPAPGAYSITVRATDASGNTSDDAARDLIVQGAQSAQTILITGGIDDRPARTGAFTSGASINDDAPEIIGTLGRALQAGEEVRVLRNGQDVGDADVQGTNWRFDSEDLSDGTYSFSARVVTSDGGTVASTTGSLDVTVDTVAPARPVFDKVEGDSVVDVDEAIDGIQITGESQAGLTVAAAWGDETITGLVDPDGDYELTFETLPQGVGYGQSEIVVTAVDEAGNEGPGRLREVWVEIRPGDLVGGDNELFVQENDDLQFVALSDPTPDSGTASPLSPGSILDENSAGLTGI